MSKEAKSPLTQSLVSVQAPVKKPTLIEAGALIDQRFQLIRKIGEGGMGYVYLAEQIKIKRQIVIKLLKPQLCASEEQVNRFKREAELACRLSHPNCVVIHDFGFHEQIPYIAMEYLEGRPLSEEIFHRKRLPLVEIEKIISQVCDALEASRSLGIVHRDLKPENIFLLNEAQGSVTVKVLDFGIAKLAHNHPGASDANLTRGDMIFGTPQYMAPEQIRGKPLDHRADIYSLTVIFYEMLTGQVPYDSEDLADVVSVLTQHLRDPIPKITVAEVGGPLRDHLAVINAFLARGMAKKPDDRFQEPNEMKTSVEKLLNLIEGAGDPSAEAQNPISPEAQRLMTRPSLLFSSLGDLTHEELATLTPNDINIGPLNQPSSVFSGGEPSLAMNHLPDLGKVEPVFNASSQKLSRQEPALDEVQIKTEVANPEKAVKKSNGWRWARRLFLFAIISLIGLVALSHPHSPLSDGHWMETLPVELKEKLAPLQHDLLLITTPIYRELPYGFAVDREGELNEALAPSDDEEHQTPLTPDHEQGSIDTKILVDPNTSSSAVSTLDGQDINGVEAGSPPHSPKSMDLAKKSMGSICVTCSEKCKVSFDQKEAAFSLKATTEEKKCRKSTSFKEAAFSVGEHIVHCLSDGGQSIQISVEVEKLIRKKVRCRFNP